MADQIGSGDRAGLFFGADFELPAISRAEVPSSSHEREETLQCRERGNSDGSA
jgi:hypothetical protein